MITVRLDGDRELILNLRAMPDRVRTALWAAVGQLSQQLREGVQNNYLSGPTGVHTLSVRSGRLRRSVTAGRYAQGPSVFGEVFYAADVPYAAIHEFGGVINVPEIRPVRRQALRFFIGGREIFATRVRAHTVTMPARAPLRTAFNAFKPTIRSTLEDAVRRALSAN